MILDASVALAWVLPDENSSVAAEAFAAIKMTSGTVPSHFILEVMNGILIAERRGRILAADRDLFAAQVARLPLQVDGQTGKRATFDTLRLASSESLTIYDAAYLELSLRLRAPLATLDEKLATALVRLGGERWSP